MLKNNISLKIPYFYINIKMKISELNWCNISLGLLILISYFTYSILGIIVLNSNNFNNLWIYNLISLLVVPFFTIIFMCGYSRDYIHYLFYLAIFVLIIVGGFYTFNNEDNNNLWQFSLTTFILQILALFFTSLIRFYAFICSLKTPCCCIDNEYTIDNQEKVNNEYTIDNDEEIVNNEP